MKNAIDALAEETGTSFFDYQVTALQNALLQGDQFPRRLLYFKTGAGKSITALGQLRMWGVVEAIVITPPSTYTQWEEAGRRFGVQVTCMSHAKFRMKTTKLSRTVAVIADEFHLFGGHGGQGWKKLDTLARHLQAPLILCSATPNYNDAERVYCIHHVLDPHSVKGGYLEFLYAHCNTKQNPFGMEPLVDDVTPFKNFAEAKDYLAALPNVDYLEDDLVYKIHDWFTPKVHPPAMLMYGFNPRKGRMVASQMEERHDLVHLSLINDEGFLRDPVLTSVMAYMRQPCLVFAAHATVAEATDRALAKFYPGLRVAIVTGTTSTKRKQARITAFKEGRIDVLIGTASLATGTDGLDKVCDTLIIVDDTDDDAQRRQLIGRIMPRGTDTDVSNKRVHRLVLM